MSIFLAVVPLILSTVAILASLHAFRTTHRTNLRPTLIFENSLREKSDKTVWCVENVGRGPAINVIMACADMNFLWKEEENILLPALSVGQQQHLDLLSVAWAFCAVYSDVDGRFYTTVCRENRNTVSLGNRYPNLTAKRYHYELLLHKNEISRALRGVSNLFHKFIA